MLNKLIILESLCLTLCKRGKRKDLVIEKKNFKLKLPESATKNFKGDRQCEEIAANVERVRDQGKEKN